MAQSENKEDLTILKRVVMIMGVMLVAGTILLIAAVIYKANNQSDKIIVSEQPASAERQYYIATEPRCTYQNAEVPVSSKILSANVNNNILTIITDKTVEPKSVSSVVDGNSLTLSAEKDHIGQQVVLIDLCSGEVISRVDLVGN